MVSQIEYENLSQIRKNESNCIKNMGHTRKPDENSGVKVTRQQCLE